MRIRRHQATRHRQQRIRHPSATNHPKCWTRSGTVVVPGSWKSPAVVGTPANKPVPDCPSRSCRPSFDPWPVAPDQFIKFVKLFFCFPKYFCKKFAEVVRRLFTQVLPLATAIKVGPHLKLGARLPSLNISQLNLLQDNLIFLKSRSIFLKANYNYAESGSRMRVSVCVGEWERIRTELDDFITKPFCFRLTDVWCTKKSVKVGTKYNVSTRGINVKTDFRIQ